MRRHGWELPYHPLQVTAIATFLALVFSFYIFFLPFAELNMLKVVINTAYTFTALVAFVLYIWCVAVDPADDNVRSMRSCILLLPCFNSKMEFCIGEKEGSCNLCREKCNTCVEDATTEACFSEHGMLYCRMCKVEIFEDSKHCRVCDKCVAGFDHHCRWLNNCIGKRNYKAFFVLILSSLVMFILQSLFGLWILVHRFLHGKHFESIITVQLGRSFSPIAYILLVALCTVVSFIASYLVGQLSCFHVLLIKKGITTYDYILAVRKQENVPDSDSYISSVKRQPDTNSQQPLPGNASSATFHPKNDWSNLARANPEEVGQETSCNPESSFSDRFFKKKTPVKLSAWTLASMKREEIIQASVKARNQSSFRQAEIESSLGSSRDFSVDYISSVGARTASHSSSHLDQTVLAPWQNGKLPLENFEPIDSSENDSGNLSQKTESDKMLSPLQREARSVFKSSHAFCAGGDSLSIDRGASSSENLDYKVNEHS